MIVSFSGIDSAGKTTQIDLLIQYCKERNISVTYLWGKARGTPGIELLKKMIRRDKKMSTEEKIEYRANIYNNSKKKKVLLVASFLDLLWYFGLYYRIKSLFFKITILDRYVWDTFIEVSTEFSDIHFEDWLLWKLVVKIAPKPKHSFLFIIPPEESLQRDLKKGDSSPDSIELKKRKIGLYLELKDKGKWIHVMDGMNTREDLHNNVIGILKM